MENFNKEDILGTNDIESGVERYEAEQELLKELSLIKEALEWWNTHFFLVHQELTNIYYSGRSYVSLTEEEIVEIYKKEGSL